MQVGIMPWLVKKIGEQKLVMLGEHSIRIQ